MNRPAKKEAIFPHRLRNSIILYYLSTILLILSGLGTTLYFLTKQQLENEMGKRLIAIGTITAQQIPSWQLEQMVAGAENSKVWEALRTRLVRAVGTGQVSRAYIADLEGNSLVDSDAEVPFGTPYYDHSLYKQELARAAAGAAAHSTPFMGSNHTYYKRAFTPLVLNGKTVAILGLQASADFFGGLNQLRRYLIYSIFVISALIVVISILISARIVDPINDLIEASRRIGEGDLNTPVTLPHRNEIGLLGNAIDEMRFELLGKENRMKAMLQGIAHEIRNPLGGIELFAGLLKEDLPTTATSQQESVAKIQLEVQNLKAIVEQFLDFARELAPEATWIEVAPMLEETLALLMVEAKRGGVDLKSHVDPDIQRFWLDPRLIRQALLNLVHNAIQAIAAQKRPAGEGHVTLAALRYQDADSGTHGMLLRVTDNGPGILNEHRDQLFRPFFTTKERGCGLGLAFAQKIAQAHRGEINVDTQPGVGSTFTIVIPSLAPGGNSL